MTDRLTEGRDGSQFKPLTHVPPSKYESGDWGDLWCECTTCGMVGTCTFSFDFYRTPGDETGALECETCSRKGWFKK